MTRAACPCQFIACVAISISRCSISKSLEGLSLCFQFSIFNYPAIHMKAFQVCRRFVGTTMRNAHTQGVSAPDCWGSRFSNSLVTFRRAPPHTYSRVLSEVSNDRVLCQNFSGITRWSVRSNLCPYQRRRIFTYAILPYGMY